MIKINKDIIRKSHKAVKQIKSVKPAKFDNNKKHVSYRILAFDLPNFKIKNELQKQ